MFRLRYCSPAAGLYHTHISVRWPVESSSHSAVSDSSRIETADESFSRVKSEAACPKGSTFPVHSGVLTAR